MVHKNIYVLVLVQILSSTTNYYLPYLMHAPEYPVGPLPRTNALPIYVPVSMFLSSKMPAARNTKDISRLCSTSTSTHSVRRIRGAEHAHTHTHV